MMRMKVPYTISLLVFVTVFAISIVFGSDVRSGKEVYNRHCATCHGESGKGDGPIGKALKLKPGNFKKDVFKQGCSPSEIASTVNKGIKGSKSMLEGAFELKGSEAVNVAKYILETFVPKETADKCKKIKNKIK